MIQADAAATRRHAFAVLEWEGVTAALAERCASAAAARHARLLGPSLVAVDLSDDSDGPATDEDGAPTLCAVQSSLAAIDEARLLGAGGGLPVGGVRDVKELVERAAAGRVLEPAELGDVGRTAEALDRLRERLAGEGKVAPLLALLASRIEPFGDLARGVAAAIDERGDVRPDATPRLVQLARRRAQAAAAVEETLVTLRRDPDIAAALSDDYATLRDGRPVLPVRAERRMAVPGILHGRSGSGRTLFIEPSVLVELGNDLRTAGFEHDEEVERILRDLSTAVARAAPALGVALRAHLRLDLAAAAARLAATLALVTPEVAEGGDLVLPALAHPLLLLQRSGRAGEAARVVRNDVRLEGERRGLVLSGPNTGGKTVLLKATGLAALMASCGLPVACAGLARVPLLRSVFADIGDEQSLAESLSSFSGHVRHLEAILRACAVEGARCLVLIDEIMAGTDPTEGSALAQAVLEQLAATGARVVVTTHHARLKAFAAESPSYDNAGLELDAATLQPTWRVRTGMPGASAALAIGERLGLPGDLLQRARDLTGEKAVAVERLLLDLEAARSAAISAEERLASAREEAEAARAALEAERERLRRRDAVVVTEERATFDRELKGLRAEAARITAELQARPSLPRAAQAIQRLEAIRALTAEAATEALPGRARSSAAEPPPLEPGVRVRSLALERDGQVVDAPDARGRVRVAFGAVTMQVDAADLVAPGAAASVKASTGPQRDLQRRAAARAAREEGATREDGPGAEPGEGGGAIPFTPQSARNTCDVRGRRVDEALGEISRFLEAASAAGERCAIVIHGHGTGALKSAVRRELPAEARVVAFRPGGDGEGGDGVTVVRLR